MSGQTSVASARSLDGRTFETVLPTDSTMAAGDLVLLSTADGTTVCGQLLAKRFDGSGTAGSGTVVGVVGDDAIALGPSRPFVDASVSPAGPETAALLHHGTGADMAVGTVAEGHALLRSKGLNRHTFLCGQSGSGKSYALGRLLEQVLVDTDLPIVILDPNADFVRLGETLPTADDAVRRRLETQHTMVLRPRPEAGEAPLRVRFTALSPASKAAVLQLDPIADRDEYHTLLDLSGLMGQVTPEEAVERLMRGDSRRERMLAERIQNLAILDWDVWAHDSASAVELLDQRPRTMVLDLSGFDNPYERLVVAHDMLEHLWAERGRREPRLVVVDEAHNVCSAAPSNLLERAITERLVQIASEGRKYGLWLLLCTQRPSRIHRAVLSQCDNLVLMKMNSRGDLAELQDVFGFAPPDLVAAAPYFRQGECLMAGGFTSVPSMVRIGQRHTFEGGSDVAVPLATP
jgi:DNA helicase HerA-like ATPase